MSVRQGDVVPHLYGHSRRVGLEETVDQRRRCDLRRWSPASGRHQLLRRWNDRTAEYSQHFTPPKFLLSHFPGLENSLLQENFYLFGTLKLWPESSKLGQGTLNQRGCISIYRRIRDGSFVIWQDIYSAFLIFLFVLSSNESKVVWRRGGPSIWTIILERRWWRVVTCGTYMMICLLARGDYVSAARSHLINYTAAVK